MNGFLWAFGGATVLFAGVLSYATTRRYGWGAALALPVLALVAMLGMQWQRHDLGWAEGSSVTLASLGFASPLLLGVLAGIALARLRRG
jgi:hypothetical protein